MRGVAVAVLVLICMSATSAIRLSNDKTEKLKQDRMNIISDQHRLINDEQTYEKDLESELGEPHVAELEDSKLKNSEELPPRTTEDETEGESQDQVEDEQLTDPSKTNDEEARVEHPEVEQSEGGVDKEALKSALKSYYEGLTEAVDVPGDFSPKETEANVDAIIAKYGLTNEGIESLKADLSKKYGTGHTLNIGGGESPSMFRFRSKRAKTEMSSTKKLLRKYYAKINPSKLKDVDLIVSKVHGDIEHLSSLLKTKYGVALNEIDNVDEQESSASSMLEENVSMEVFSKDEVKNKLLQLYAVNEPSKLPYIDALMEMYEGREGELLHAAKKKYTTSE